MALAGGETGLSAVGSGGGETGRSAAGSRGGEGGGESGKTVGDVLGLCIGDGSGLAGLSGMAAGLSGMAAGLSGMAAGFLGGETHRERLGGDASSGPLLLLFLDLPLWLAPVVPVEVPGVAKETVSQRGVRWNRHRTSHGRSWGSRWRRSCR